MKISHAIWGGVVLVCASAGFADAANFQLEVDKCVAQFANTHDTATVMLQCKAADGKLSNCTVLDAPNPPKGFDKAAICVAEALPMGSKTGDVKVPIKFEGH